MSRKAIRVFCERHPESCNALDHWHRVARRAIWVSFADVRQSFNTADSVAPYVVFDIGGNKFRLIAEINFSRKVLFIRNIMLHKEYAKRGRKP